jgi:hypothetical protein
MKTQPDADTYGRHRFTLAAAFCLCFLLAVAAIAQTAPAIPAKSGDAAGMVQAGKTIVTLKHAYALGPIDRGGEVYQIMLTDGPVPSDVVAKELALGGGQSLLRSGKLSGITLLVDSTGFVRTMVPFIGDLRGSQMLASAGQLDRFAAAPTGITGQGSKGAADTMGQGWSYAASWNTAITKP